MQRDSYEGRKSFAEQFMILTFYTYENSFLLKKKISEGGEEGSVKCETINLKV